MTGWRGNRMRALAALLVLAPAGCGGARPYRAMARAGTSEEGIVGQVEDDRLKLRLREALLAEGLGTQVTPYVFMGRVFLVGAVDSPQTAEQAIATARSLQAVQSVDSYLPVKPRRGLERKASDVAIDATVKTMIGVDRDERVTRVDVYTIDGHVVLLGAEGPSITFSTGPFRGVGRGVLPHRGILGRRHHAGASVFPRDGWPNAC